MVFRKAASHLCLRKGRWVSLGAFIINGFNVFLLKTCLFVYFFLSGNKTFVSLLGDSMCFSLTGSTTYKPSPV